MSTNGTIIIAAKELDREEINVSGKCEPKAPTLWARNSKSIQTLNLNKTKITRYIKCPKLNIKIKKQKWRVEKVNSGFIGRLSNKVKESRSCN